MLIASISTGLLISIIFMTIGWRFSKERHEADIVDFLWTISLGIFAWIYFFTLSANYYRSYLMLLMSFGWSIRLASHLLIKRVAVKGEDSRYLKLRNYWGAKANRNFLFFFYAQSILAAILSSCYVIATSNPSHFSYYDILAAAIFCIAIAGEHIADEQLANFKSNTLNHHKVCQTGLWRYSRHPNYFFEFLIWCSFIPLSIGHQYWYISLISPSLILVSILFFTGIPPLEKNALISKGDAYRAYQKRTSKFIPWFRKNDQTFSRLS